MKNDRKKLEDFLNGKTDKLKTSSTQKAVILIEPSKTIPNFAQIFGWKETVEIPISEIDDYFAKIPKHKIGFVMDFCRPITAQELEAEQAKNSG